MAISAVGTPSHLARRYTKEPTPVFRILPRNLRVRSDGLMTWRFIAIVQIDDIGELIVAVLIRWERTIHALTVRTYKLSLHCYLKG